MAQNSGKKIVDSFYKSPLNNADYDPMQGYDADVWVLDQATGSYTLVGRFVSIQLTIRNTTEPYLELNQRIPRYLDGEIQIGWVMERGQLDDRVLQQTFGYDTMTRQLRVNRMSRFQITFAVNAPDLEDVGKVSSSGSPDTYLKRTASGKLRLTMCKVDSLTIGATAGRSVIANRWEGVAEGIEYVDNVQTDPGIWLDATAALASIKTTNAIEEALNPFPWDINIIS